jgi:hypothetical protein
MSVYQLLYLDRLNMVDFESTSLINILSIAAPTRNLAYYFRCYDTYPGQVS